MTNKSLDLPELTPGRIRQLLDRAQKKREERMAKAEEAAEERDEVSERECPVCAGYVYVRYRQTQEAPISWVGGRVWDPPLARAVSAYCISCGVELKADKFVSPQLTKKDAKHSKHGLG